MNHAGPVAVVTEVDDVTADMVITELNKRGVPVVRFDPSDIGDRLSLSARFGASRAATPAGHLRTPSRTTALEGVRSLYWRRPTWPCFEHLDDQDARFAAAQVRHGLGGTLYALANCRYVNHPFSNYAAEHKPMQLAVAERLGLTVPPTLISNDLADIRAFITEHGRAIYKTLRWTPYRRGDGVGLTTWTEPVTADEVDESVAEVPHLFQARVDKVADLRVVIVGPKAFAIRIDSDLLDWRADYSALTYAPVALPANVEKALTAHLEHFGLASGSFDLCITRDGDLHWLELNPNGQWGWLEDETGLPIAAAFADLLEQGASTP
ncbi:ATP-grasp ribosomal peptide maturase [Streptomyces sp. RY43-2]|uniref:ATP-grasp ribosomal peptide maturase n=1 Tax=Streptomyces macrolidinus TaxID=2952607 RepID=A0ABT0Z718_9ACTN|nr:ATP-grasp ribosomal peptide maturase [Streptomyces macrolidinus]MCN9239563.1 ATP-grasp ribosomal peptide maturase [Streptomyces macrolidinus]